MDITYGIYHFSSQYVGISIERMERSKQENSINHRHRHYHHDYISADDWLWEFIKIITRKI